MSKGSGGITGYRYYMGLHMIGGMGPVDALLQINAGDRVAWSGERYTKNLDGTYTQTGSSSPVTQNETIFINAPDLFGGQEKEGGLQGQLEVMMGAPDQLISSYLVQKQGAPQSAYRGVFGFVYRGGLVSCNNPYLKAWSFKVRRILKGWQNGGTAWYPEKASIDLGNGAKGMNPAHMIYECLTNQDWGMGYPGAQVNDANFRAAADTFYAEGLGLCMKWSRQEQIEEFVQVIAKHCGANLTQDRETDLFVLVPIRGGYDVADLPAFGPDNVLELEKFERASLAEAVNEITVTYTDVFTGTKQVPVTVQNLANITSQGGVVSKTTPYPGAPTHELATRFALRDLKAVSTAIAKARIKVNRKAYKLLPGHLIRFSWPKMGLVDLPMRILAVDYGQLTSGAISLEVCEDVFELPATAYVGQQSSDWVDPVNQPAAAARRLVTEAPYWELTRQLGAAELAAVPSTAGYLYAACGRPSSDAIDFGIVTSDDGYKAAAGRGGFCPTARLSLELTATAATMRIVDVKDARNIKAGSYAFVGDEIVRVDSFNEADGSCTIGRGVLDTVAAKHAVNTIVFFPMDAATSDRIERSDGEGLGVKLLPRTGLGSLAASLAAVDTVVFDQRHFRPYPPGRLTVNGVLHPTTIATAALSISWARRNRLTQNLQGDETGDITPEPGTTYSARIVRVGDGVVVASVAGITGTSWAVNVPSGSYDIEVWSVRGGLESRQRGKVVGVTVAADNIAAWNRRWGWNWGLKTALRRLVDITIAGGVDIGAKVSATLGGTKFTYTEQAGDTVNDLAAELAALIDAHASYTATADGPVVHVSGPLRQNYSVAVDVATDDQAALSVSTIRNAAAVTAGNRFVVFLKWDGYPLPSNWNPSLPHLFYLRVRKVGPGGSTAADFQARVSLPNLSIYQPAKYVTDGLLVSNYGIPGDTPLSMVPGVTEAGIAVFQRPPTAEATPAGWADGFYTPGDPLIAQCDHAIVFPIGEWVTVKNTPEDPYALEEGGWEVYTYSAPDYPSGATAKPIITGSPHFQRRVDAPGIAQLSRVDLTGAVAAGDVLTLTINGTPYSHTALAGQDRGDALDALLALVNAGASGVTASEARAGTMRGTESVVLNFVVDFPFVDTSTNEHAVALYGDAIYDYAPGTYLNAGALKVSGAGYLRVSQSEDAPLHAGFDDFTFEAVITPNSSAATNRIIAAFGDSPSDRGASPIALWMTDDKVYAKWLFYWPAGGFSVGATSDLVAVPIGSRSHVVVQRRGDNVEFLVNGDLVQTWPIPHPGLEVGPPLMRTEPLFIGGGPNAGTTAPESASGFVGKVEAFRFLIGEALYSDGYAVPTGAFPWRSMRLDLVGAPGVAFTVAASSSSVYATTISYSITQQAQ